MDVSDAERFVHDWGVWESGRCSGLEEAIGIIANNLHRDEVTPQQLEAWQEMYDLLVKARSRSTS